MKGCFTDMHECNQTECVTSAEPRQGNINFCCCKGSRCNSNQKYIRSTTEATTQGGFSFGFGFVFILLLRGFVFGVFTPILLFFRLHIFFVCFLPRFLLHLQVAKERRRTLCLPNPSPAIRGNVFRVNELSTRSGTRSPITRSIPRPHQPPFGAACVAISALLCTFAGSFLFL